MAAIPPSRPSRPEIWNGWLVSGFLRESPSFYEVIERSRLWTTDIMRDALEAGETMIANGTVVSLEKRAGVRTRGF